LCNDEDGHKELEYDDHLPVPFAETSTAGDVLLAAIVDPDLKMSALAVVARGVSTVLTANERAYTVKGLPERHNLAANLLRGQLSNVDRSGGYVDC
jgi:hypothetical protein